MPKIHGDIVQKYINGYDIGQKCDSQPQ